MWNRSRWLPLARPDAMVYAGRGRHPAGRAARQQCARVGVTSIEMKCEHLNPTGSFKDRIASVAVSLAVERGVPGLVGTSSGNGGAAAAAYCARAGLSLTLFALSDVVPEKLLQIRAFGARVCLVDGLGHDARVDGTRRHDDRRPRRGRRSVSVPDRRPVLARGDGGREDHRARDRGAAAGGHRRLRAGGRWRLGGRVGPRVR